MKTLGIIAEYDPFHNGHVYHLKESKRKTGADFVVCVMSGDFVQRGGPALYNKRIRAEAAVKNGIDLLIELPFVYASGNAEMFAKGAVGILNGLGVVNYISFGSEVGRIEALNKLACFFADDADKHIKAEIKKGCSYPAALEAAAESALGKEYSILLRSPNNTLGVEYLKQLYILNSKIKPVTITRYAAGLDESAPEKGIAGATALRKMLINGEDISEYIPEKTAKTLRPEFVTMEDMLAPLLYSVLMSDRKKLAEVLSATEGLENRLISAARKAGNMAEIIKLTKTKRYTETRIRRLITHTVMGLTKESMDAALAEPLYARVLAVNKSGQEVLRQIRKNQDDVSVRFVSNVNKAEEIRNSSPVTMAFDMRAADLRYCLESGAMNGFDDSRIPPLLI